MRMEINIAVSAVARQQLFMCEFRPSLCRDRAEGALLP
jgi:hypothetical protein